MCHTHTIAEMFVTPGNRVDAAATLSIKEKKKKIKKN